MISFKEYNDEREYFQAIRLLESDTLDEGLWTSLSSGIKKKIEFIKQLASASKNKLSDVLKLMKDNRAFKFFKSIGFNIKKLFKMIKKGYGVFGKIEKIIADYVASTKVVKWTEGELKKLDAFLMNHPNIKRFSGILVSGLLIYIWLNMSFTPDLEYSMDFDSIVLAATGNFSLSDLFAGAEGVKLLTYFVTGALLGLSFPWPGPTSIQFVSGVIYSIGKMIQPKLKLELAK